MFDIAWFPLVVTVYGIAGIVCAVGAYFTAQRKFRDRQSWAFWCFFVPPAYLILLWLGPARRVGSRHGVPRHDDDDDNDGDAQATNIATRLP